MAKRVHVLVRHERIKGRPDPKLAEGVHVLLRKVDHNVPIIPKVSDRGIEKFSVVYVRQPDRVVEYNGNELGDGILLLNVPCCLLGFLAHWIYESIDGVVNDVNHFLPASPVHLVTCFAEFLADLPAILVPHECAAHVLPDVSRQVRAASFVLLLYLSPRSGSGSGRRPSLRGGRVPSTWCVVPLSLLRRGLPHDLDRHRRRRLLEVGPVPRVVHAAVTSAKGATKMPTEREREGNELRSL
mmetsp:Transcript_15212/g.38664  ORF Transcript_15212/g.38664 Transcript_15212/m.38664 type:complete len:241 (+) Transcript_15212:1768-2490(+)